MKGVNLVVLLGRLGNDPEVKTLANGNSVASFSLATGEVWVDKDGQKKEKTEWHKIVVWGKLAEVVGKYLKKGSEAHIQGKLATRSWEDKDGQKKYMTEIIANQIQFVGNNKNSNRQEQAHVESEEDFTDNVDDSSDDNDEIPF